MRRNFGQFVGLFFILASVAGAQTSVVLDDFSGGVLSKKQPTSGGDYVTWFDSWNKAQGVPAASVAPIPGAMQIAGETDANGVYRIFQAVVPSTGSWHVNCKVQVIETSPSLNAIQNFQVGAIVNGVQRSTGNTKIAAATIFAQVPAGYLTAGDDTSKGIQNLRTPDFVANAGDDILISLATDVTSGNFNLGSVGTWAPSYVWIDDIVLEQQGLPVAMSGWSLE